MTHEIRDRQLELTPLLDETLAAIRPLDAEAMAGAQARQDLLTKPRGSLGVVEDISVRLAGITGTCPPPMPQPAAVAVFAADHGVYAQGVTPWPQEITGQMVANVLGGGAAVSVLADQLGVHVRVIDVGVATPIPGDPSGLVRRAVCPGTADMCEQPAMTRNQALAALEVGIETARELADEGYTCLLTGDLGIANTTASAALIAAFCAADPGQVTGRGAGIDDETWRHKVEVVRKAVARHVAEIGAETPDPVAVLAAVGGLEHAAIAGFILGAAARGVPVILDGVIAASSALAAQALEPLSTERCLSGHRSTEPGHLVANEYLGLCPIVELDLRLGEGTGAVLAYPLVQAAVRVLRDMSTFADAGVSGADVAERAVHG
jgi:nicotinate-nucleotide--dimethylbenzimidazole phosphoribosyltransferase